MNITKTLQIARREFLATVMTKGFLIGLLVMPLMIAALIVVMPFLLKEQSPRIEGSVAIHDPTGQVLERAREHLSPQAFAQRRVEMQRRLDSVLPDAMRGLVASGGEDAMQAAMEQALGAVPTLTLDALDSAAALETAKEALRESDTALAVVAIAPDAVTAGEDGLGTYDLFVRKKLDDRLIDELRDALATSIVDARLAARDLDAREVRQLVRVPRATPRTIGEEGEKSANEIASRLLPMAFMALILIAVMTGGQQLMTSTIEEKSSRVVEVLLSAVSPTELMAGKILGQMGVATLMLALYGGLGVLALVSFAATGLLDPWLLFYLAVFFLIAFVVLAAMMAAIGAAVNELREAQTLLTPVMLVVMLPMMLWMPISRDPNSTFATVLSLLPPVNPFVMMLRLGSSTPPPTWQVWLSIGIGVASMAAAVWFAGKVFRIGLLMHGKPPSFATLLRWVRMG
ncbi:ABC transporter permease [Denitratimonas sp. CY0512]|uniref:ABC transporter permease n=1 Tax=Denitratimonas sp. CY0512 TaxID=3131940 RepID=UPI00309F3B2E